jgi:hypothetical protein
VASRALAFADPDVIRLAAEAFVPVAENCTPLQRQEDDKGRFFRLVAEQGHYGGRTVPSATRQGQYAFTADGRLLASVNAREAAPMRAMLTQALERWRALGAAGPSGADAGTDAAPDGPYARDPRYPDRYPEGGLVLKQTLRDLPRPPDHPVPQARPDAVNFDYVWFTAAEARRILPPALRAGERAALPGPLVRRLARFHLLDSVRGETPAWGDAHVIRADIWSEVTAVESAAPAPAPAPGHPERERAGRVHVRLEGAVLCQQAGAWAVRPFRRHWEGLTRGYDCRLMGEAVYDAVAGRFERFDLLALGDRWGGTEHNARQEDLQPAPLGIAFELAGDSPADRTPPHADLRAYFDLPGPAPLREGGRHP